MDYKIISDEEKFTETVKKVMKLREESLDAWSWSNRATAEVMKYVKNEPYTEQEKLDAEKAKRPLLSYNLLISKLQTIIGNEQANRRTVKILPDYHFNEDMINLLSSHREFIKHKYHLDDKQVQQLVDALLFPKGGWLRGFIDVNEEGYNTLNYKLLAPLQVHPDGEMRKTDMSDCKYVVVDEWMSLDEIRNKWGVTDLDGEDKIEWWERVESAIQAKEGETQENPEYRRGDRYLVCELEERITIKTVVCDVNGERMKLTNEEIREHIAAGNSVKKIKDGYQRRMKFTTVVPYFSKVVLMEQYNPLPIDSFSLFPCFSFDWNFTKSEQPSWGYLLLDPMDNFNKRRSQITSYMSEKVGGSWHINKHEKEAVEALENHAGEPNLVVKYDNVKHNKAIRETGAADGASIAVIQQDTFADLNFLQEISNVTDALMGKGGKSAESGKLYEMKLGQSQLSSNPFYEIKNKVGFNIERHWLEMVPHLYFEDNRKVPLLHDGSLTYDMVNMKIGEEVFKDVRKAVANCMLDTQENTLSRMDKAFEENLAIAKMMLEYGWLPELIPWDLLLKNSTVRDKKEWEEVVKRGMEVMRNVRVHKEAQEATAMEMDLIDRGMRGAK